MIVRLAFRDLLHDWLLSTCLVLAIASIIAPLLILFGLKSGVIGVMRGRLVEDPANREIRPAVSRRFPRSWFEQVRGEHPEVAFVIPMTRQISTSVTAVAPGGKRTPLSLMATGADDPLLTENGAAVPGKGACVLTDGAAAALAIDPGTDLRFEVTRIVHGQPEKARLSLRVGAVLNARASGLKAAYVPLEVLEAVEDFRDGRAVPAFDWPGRLPEAYPVYDGVLVLTREPLAKLEQIRLISGTGFSDLKTLSAAEAEELLNFPPAPGWHICRVAVKKRPAGEESVRAVRHKLRGTGAVVLPWIRPLAVKLSGAGGGTSIPLRLFALDPQAARVGGPEELLPTSSREPHIACSDDIPLQGASLLTVTVDGRSLSLPVSVFGKALSPGTAMAATGLAGRLNLLRQRDLAWDQPSATLLLSRRGYAGFRMYTRTIDQVEKMEQVLARQGITVHTKKQRIAEVRRLDRYLGLIFWLIATVGVIGGVSALTASLYASVERKKKELNMLRLLGFLKREIVLFPVCQGLILSGTGLAVAGMVFILVSRVIDRLFSSHLRGAESLCTLHANQVVILVAGLAVSSVCSAVLAALQAVRLDPAEALRDE